MGSRASQNLFTNLAASADLTTKQNKAVVINSSGTIAVAGAAANVLGFLANAPISGAVCSIAGVGGGALAIAGGTITAGDLLETDANGDVVVATGAAENICAQALESAVDNDVFNVVVYMDRVANTV